jgi:hypothetical protein
VSEFRPLIFPQLSGLFQNCPAPEPYIGLFAAIREKSLIRKCYGTPRSSAQRFVKRHFRVRVLLYRGGLVSSAFSDCSVDLMWDVTRRVLASLRDRHFGPPMMGSGGCGGPIYRDVLAVRLTAGIRTRNGLASSIVPAGTSLHRSAEFSFLLSLLCTTRGEIRHDERHKCALTARPLLSARSR